MNACNAGRSLLFPKRLSSPIRMLHTITGRDSPARRLRSHIRYRNCIAPRPHSPVQRMLRPGNRKRRSRRDSWCNGKGQSFDSSFDSSLIGWRSTDTTSDMCIVIACAICELNEGTDFVEQTG
jgi:hypothetical protein